MFKTVKVNNEARVATISRLNFRKAMSLKKLTGRVNRINIGTHIGDQLEVLNKRDVLRFEPMKKTSSNSFETKITSGYGSCKACSCGGFMQNPNDPNDYICYACGHHYSMHY